MKCNICGTEMLVFDTALLMNKYNVAYYQCKKCGFICTEKPYWLGEAYDNTGISDSDIGLLNRNIYLGEITKAVLKMMFPNAQSFLDWGGGYGIFTRLMRDSGFDFQWYDKYCENLFAKSSEKTKNHYDVITAFELFEHLEDPVKDIGEILEQGDNLIFTTALLPSPAPKIKEWWYYGTEHGQHISFYTSDALIAIGKKYERCYVGAGNYHLLSRNTISNNKLRVVLKFKNIINRFLRKQSLLEKDYEDTVKKTKTI